MANPGSVPCRFDTGPHAAVPAIERAVAIARGWLTPPSTPIQAIATISDDLASIAAS